MTVPCRTFFFTRTLIMLSQFEFSQNFTPENMENLESVKSIVKSNFKMCLILNIQGFNLQKFCKIFTDRLQVEKSS